MRAAAVTTETQRRSLRHRDRQPELMDDSSLPVAEHEAALRGLARLNHASFAAASLWRVIGPLARSIERPVRLLDVATGAGDVLAGVLRRAQRSGVQVEAVACDISATALAAARATARRAGVEAEFLRLDVQRASMPGGFDFATCSLFLHHLDDDAAVGLLRRIGGASRFVIASDLVRSRSSYAMVWAASRVLTRSPVVHTDAMLSVRGAYTPDELSSLAVQAGLRSARIHSAWPARMTLVAGGPP